MWTWGVIILIMLSLIGSMMWAMPTRREKAQAQLRSRARTLGMHVQLVRLEAPRATGESDPQEYSCAAYRLLRKGLSASERERLRPWQVFRTRSLACEGLPDGWSWKLGERMLVSSPLGMLAEALQRVPQGVIALESTPLHVTAFWDERGGLDELDRIADILQRIADQNV
jgi:hypothetical protein